MTRGPGQESPYTARKEGHPPFGEGPPEILEGTMPPFPIGAVAPIGMRIVQDHDLIPEAHWFACEYPERPFDPDKTRFMAWCRPCRLSARAAIANGFGEARRHVTLERWLDGAEEMAANT